VLEDGKPLLGPADADLTSEVSKIGKGSYCFWTTDVFFSTSDNSDPRTNGRLYEISYPATDIVGNSTAYLLYLITVLVIVLTIVWLVNKKRALPEKEKAVP
jgi:hypothetical protein